MRAVARDWCKLCRVSVVGGEEDAEVSSEGWGVLSSFVRSMVVDFGGVSGVGGSMDVRSMVSLPGLVAGIAVLIESIKSHIAA